MKPPATASSPTRTTTRACRSSYNTPQQLIGFLPGGLKLTAAFINGTGRASEDTDRRIDQVYRAAYQTPNKVLGVGVSYWDGQLGAAGATGNFGRKRQLYGADAQLTFPFGVFLQGEYVGGKLSSAQRSRSQTTLATVFAPGNKIEGYYVQGGYTFSPAGSHPLSLFASYDVLRRAEGSAGASGSYTDENIGYGAVVQSGQSDTSARLLHRARQGRPYVRLQSDQDRPDHRRTASEVLSSREY